MAVTVGLLVMCEAKPGMESEVEQFLRTGGEMAKDEPGTVAWFGVRLGPTTYGIIDFFPDDGARTAHLQGKIAQALGERSEELFTKAPDISPLDVLVAKLP
jgi:quinol monooxygenase YgiN